MRPYAVFAAALSLSAVPAFAQSPRDVTGPWTLTPNMVLCTDLPAVARPARRIVVKGAHHLDHFRSISPGGEMVIARSADDGLEPGKRYLTGRINGDERKFPRSGEGFGDVRLTGIVTIKAVDEVNAIGHVDFACDSIEIGDFLEPYATITLPTSAAADTVAPDFTDRASLLFGAEGRVMVGQGDVVSIDRGTLHGVVAGERYAVYRDTRNGLPLIYIGELVVLSTGELTSKVMVTRASGGIEMGDLAVPRRQP